jgi:hypothetical protein
MLTGKRLGRILPRASETQHHGHIRREPAKSSGTSTVRQSRPIAGDGDLGTFLSKFSLGRRQDRGNDTSWLPLMSYRGRRGLVALHSV